MELLAEPQYILSQNLLLLKLRLMVETVATLLRCLTTYFLIVKQVNMVMPHYIIWLYFCVTVTWNHLLVLKLWSRNWSSHFPLIPMISMVSSLMLLVAIYVLQREDCFLILLAYLDTCYSYEPPCLSYSTLLLALHSLIRCPLCDENFARCLVLFMEEVQLWIL